MIHSRLKVKQIFKKSLFLLLLSSITGCAGSPSILSPNSPPARQIATLWWVMFGAGTVVFLVVAAYLFLIIRKHRSDERDEIDNEIGDNHETSGRRVVTWAGAIIPAFIVVALMFYTTYVLAQVGSPPEAPELLIEVTSHDWWWEVEYPQYAFETANEIHIPVNQPVRIHLTSDDVIHSFWVPELQGKTDMMPGHTSTTWLMADNAGTYRGQCAEFCGLQHAKMSFLVIAEEAEDFEAWLENQQSVQTVETGSDLWEGQQIFLGSECVYCHAIRGTNASGDLGPDLTHIASRAELGAGTLPNTPGNLAGWILNSQQFKQGNRMPPMPIGSGELQKLLAYLNSLE